VKNLLPLLKKMKKIEGGSKFFSFRFSLLPFFITFAPDNQITTIKMDDYPANSNKR
jgi:hypothetical protein